MTQHYEIFQTCDFRCICYAVVGLRMALILFPSLSACRERSTPSTEIEMCEGRSQCDMVDQVLHNLVLLGVS